MKSLEVLDLYYNHLESLPASITKLENLTQLAVSHNQLKSLPEHLGKLTNVHTFYAHHNKLSKLPESVRKMKKLNVLDLGYNWFYNFPTKSWRWIVYMSLTFQEIIFLNSRQPWYNLKNWTKYTYVEIHL